MFLVKIARPCARCACGCTRRRERDLLLARTAARNRKQRDSEAAIEEQLIIRPIFSECSWASSPGQASTVSYFGVPLKSARDESREDRDKMNLPEKEHFVLKNNTEMKLYRSLTFSHVNPK